MIRFAHIIVEKHSGQWSAWFRGTPQVACGGESPLDAATRLIGAVGREEFNFDDLVPVQGANSGERMEVFIRTDSDGG